MGHLRGRDKASFMSPIPHFPPPHEWMLAISLVLFAWLHGIGDSPKKLLYNGICYPSSRSKQIQETHMAYSAGTQYTRQSLNETQHTWLHRQQVIVCEVMYAVFYSNFAAYIVCRRYKPCGFLGLVWTDCWGNKSNYVITSPANCNGQHVVFIYSDTSVRQK